MGRRIRIRKNTILTFSRISKRWIHKDHFQPSQIPLAINPCQIVVNHHSHLWAQWIRARRKNQLYRKDRNRYQIKRRVRTKILLSVQLKLKIKSYLTQRIMQYSSRKKPLNQFKLADSTKTTNKISGQRIQSQLKIVKSKQILIISSIQTFNQNSSLVVKYHQVLSATHIKGNRHFNKTTWISITYLSQSMK